MGMRPVFIAVISSSGLTRGKHPVAGATGKWFAERTIIGKQITESIGKYPDPTQHWAVIVGDYVHQLWMVSRRFVRPADRRYAQG